MDSNYLVGLDRGAPVKSITHLPPDLPSLSDDELSTLRHQLASSTAMTNNLEKMLVVVRDELRRRGYGPSDLLRGSE